MIHMAIPNLTGHEKEYLDQCIDTTFVSSVGAFVNRFEEMTAELSDARFSVATSSGTTALHTALMSVGVKPRDIVIVPSFTFIASANAISHCGALPWLTDIDKESWTMSVPQVSDMLKKCTEVHDNQVFHRESGRRVAAIMPVYTLGNVPDMDSLNDLAKVYRLPVVADAACALGATYKGSKLGPLADLTCYSFNGNKTFTAGGGGAIVGNDEVVLARARHISTTARTTTEYDFDMVGYNYRMTNIQAAVGCAQLERFEEFIGRKREVRSFYNSAFQDCDKCSTFPVPEACESACWFSGIVLDMGGIERVRQICSSLKDRGIEARSFWKPIHMQVPYANAYKADYLSNTESLWNRIITLPCSTGITDEELKNVADEVHSILLVE